MDSSREPMWTPRGIHTNMDTFRERVNERHSLSLGNSAAAALYLHEL